HVRCASPSAHGGSCRGTSEGATPSCWVASGCRFWKSVSTLVSDDRQLRCAPNEPPIVYLLRASSVGPFRSFSPECSGTQQSPDALLLFRKNAPQVNTLLFYDMFRAQPWSATHRQRRG